MAASQAHALNMSVRFWPPTLFIFTPVVQLVEFFTHDETVVGSSPVRCKIFWRSSVVEHLPEKQGVACSIHAANRRLNLMVKCLFVVQCNASSTLAAVV